MFFKFLQDRYRIALEGELKRLQGEQELLRGEFEILKTNMANLRGMVNRKLSGRSEESEQGAPDMDAIIKAFGGVPIELARAQADKYKNMQGS